VVDTCVLNLKLAAILTRRQRGESIRTIADRVNVSIGVVHQNLAVAQRYQ
jgi:transposase